MHKLQKPSLCFVHVDAANLLTSQAVNSETTCVNITCKLPTVTSACHYTVEVARVAEVFVTLARSVFKTAITVRITLYNSSLLNL